MTRLRVFRTLLRRFRRRDEGSFSIEAVLILPLMAWAMLSAFSYFDGLRQNTINIKAAHTLSDVLSRETVPVDAAYVAGLQDMLDFLTGHRFQTALRVSVFEYDDTASDFELVWSQGTNTTPALTDATQDLVQHRLPLTANGDTVITVETWLDYRALFSMGLGDTVLYQMAVTRPRYVPQLVYQFPDGTTTGSGSGGTVTSDGEGAGS